MRKDLQYSDGRPIEPGHRVRLTAVRHKEFSGLTGKVKRPVKSRQIVTITLDDGRTYEAFPSNIERLTGG